MTTTASNEIRTAKGKAVKSLIQQQSGGKFFTVIFTKADGTVRTMNCRTGVKKHLAGGKSTISDRKALQSVFEQKSGGYRSFNVDNVLELHISGEIYKFDA
jgi:hypothetical protein